MTLTKAVPPSTANRGALERGLAILEHVSRRGPCSTAELGEAIGISRSASYRIVGQLRACGFLEDGGGPEQVRIGIKVVEMGLAELGSRDAVRVGAPYLRELAERTQEVTFLGVIDRDEIVYLAREEGGDHSFRLSARLGARRPVHATGLGKAILSALPDHELEQLLGELSYRPLTANTLTTPEALRDDLLDARRRGYAVDNVENEEGVVCFAAPVRDHLDRPVCAMSVAGPADRLVAKETDVASLLAEVTEALSRRLGHRP